MGEMTDLLMYDDPLSPNGDQTDYEHPISYKTCRYCGKENLVWVGKRDGVWRLGCPFTMVIHECVIEKEKEE